MGRVDAISRRYGNKEAGGYDKLLTQGDTPATQTTHLLQAQVLLLDEHELDPLPGVNISNWPKNLDSLWIIPSEHRIEVLNQCHDLVVAGHWSHNRTKEIILRNFIWDNWQKDVANYVAICTKCQKAKADRHSRQLKLCLMPTRTIPFQEIAMDFIGKLPDSEGFNAILLITDQFTKMQIYIPAKTTWTSEDIANAYLYEVWKLFSLPTHVTSNRGPQFASAFPKALNKKLDIRLRLSTAHHPQTDGLSERAIQTLKQFLRIYCHDRQHRWVQWLPLAQFCYNSTTTEMHGYTPFASTYGWNSRAIQVNEEEVGNPAAENWLERMTRVYKDISSILKDINNKCLSLHVDKAHSFHIGDKVLIDRRNLTINSGNNRSLSNKYISLYTSIDSKGSHAYKLALPARMRLHSTVHASLLKPYRACNNEDMEVDTKDESLYTIDKIINSRRFSSRVKYLIRWKGYSEDNDTWELMENLSTDSIKQLLIEFHNTPSNKRKAIHPNLEPLLA